MTPCTPRLALALGASVLAHAWLLAASPGGVPKAPAVEAWSTLSARLAVTPPEDTESLAREPLAVPRLLPMQDESRAGPVPEVGTPPARTTASATAGVSGRARKQEKSGPTPASPKLPAAVDTTWYAAHDIDVYPRPGVPLRLAPPEGAGERDVRLALWLRIDEQGEVVEVTAAEPGTPAAWVDAARASLVAIRFAPARRDERAVRSRLLLSVSFAPAGSKD